MESFLFAKNVALLNFFLQVPFAQQRRRPPDRVQRERERGEEGQGVPAQHQEDREKQVRQHVSLRPERKELVMRPKIDLIETELNRVFDYIGKVAKLMAAKPSFHLSSF